MALTRTTLSGAINANDTLFAVASATGFAVGEYLKIDDEFMMTTAVSGTNISVQRGVNGTAAVAHVVTAGVVTGTGDDFAGAAVATVATYPLAGRQRRVVSYSAAGAITLPSPGTDMVAVINGTGALAMTIADPTTDMDGDILYILGNGKAAHTVTYDAGFGDASTNYTVGTYATGGQCCLPLIAANATWVPLSSPLAGTLTAIDISIA